MGDIGEGEFVILKQIKKEDANTLNSVSALRKDGQFVFDHLSERFPLQILLRSGNTIRGCPD